jgi:hypothetical protein
MRINLHIERLILDGIAVPANQQRVLQAALEAELSQSLADGGLAPSLLASGALPFVQGGGMQLPNQASPADLGQQIAQAVYGGLGR